MNRIKPYKRGCSYKLNVEETQPPCLVMTNPMPWTFPIGTPPRSKIQNLCEAPQAIAGDEMEP
ncbi:MAG: hypothetical protein FRX49_03115 [Trebouxia sp. A1-2]|nr:MAG: hypothetical protein FRX49_03115 [Trebouxia sp. A1-2]